MHHCDKEAEDLRPLNLKSMQDFTKCALGSKANLVTGKAEDYVKNEGFRDTHLYELHKKPNYQVKFFPFFAIL